MWPADGAHNIFPPKYDIWPYKRRNTGGSITKNIRRVDFTKIHLHTKYERNPSRNAAVIWAHTGFHQNMTVWLYKRRNNGAASPQTIGVYIWLWCTSIQQLKEIRQEMQLLERKQECEPKYDIWLYKRRNTGGRLIFQAFYRPVFHNQSCLQIGL